MAQTIQILLLLLVPLLAKKINNIPAFRQWLSPVVIAYIVGIFFANVDIFPLSDGISTTATEATLILAIPMLLFSSNILTLVKTGKSSLKGFIMAIISAIIGVSLVGWFFKDTISDSWRLSGMLLGIYSGGIPNMQVIGKALEASEESIILVNAADVLLGGLYLVILSSVFYPFIKWFLPKSEMAEQGEILAEEEEIIPWSPKKLLIPFLVSITVMLSSLGLTLLIFRTLERQDQWILLFLTSFSLLVPFISKIKHLERSYEVGDYLLLSFCVALGMKADFRILIEQGMDLILFSALALYGSIALHLLLSRLFSVDRDAFMVSTTAAIFGPVFVGQIASVIGRRSMVLPGIALGLLGYAIGNYIGIGLGKLLYLLFSY